MLFFLGGGTTDGHNALIEISFAIEKGERTIIPTFIKKIDPLRWLEDQVTLEFFREANVRVFASNLIAVNGFNSKSGWEPTVSKQFG